ncbi:MAG: zinc-ribbon domain-containing protein [Desulfovibrio sp.]|nr:zinc-ribbon domain-containing protein [Desulfovibrio sp.]
MNIICPDCGFTRDVPPEMLPDHTVIANCPQCGCRFRFSPTEGFLEKVQDGVVPREEPTLGEQEGGDDRERADDPLPKGAIIVPNHPREEDEAEEQKPHAKKPSFAKELLGDGNPWSCAPGTAGWISSLVQTIVRIMLSAPRFFSSINPNASSVRALLFFLCICLFEFLCNDIWMMVFRAMIGDSTDSQLASVLAMLAPQGNIFLLTLLQLALGTLKLYCVSGMLYGVYRLLSGGEVTYGGIFQVVAYSTAPCVLAVVPLVGSLAGALWSLACLAIGIRQHLGLTWIQTFTGFLPMLVLYALCMRYLTIV